MRAAARARGKGRSLGQGGRSLGQGGGAHVAGRSRERVCVREEYRGGVDRLGARPPTAKSQAFASRLAAGGPCPPSTGSCRSGSAQPSPPSAQQICTSSAAVSVSQSGCCSLDSSSPFSSPSSSPSCGMCRGRVTDVACRAARPAAPSALLERAPPRQAEQHAQSGGGLRRVRRASLPPAAQHGRCVDRLPPLWLLLGELQQHRPQGRADRAAAGAGGREERLHGAGCACG